MNTLGAVLAGISLTLLVVGARRPSRVARRLALVRPAAAAVASRLRPLGGIAPDELAASGVGWTSDQLVAAKMASALVAALLAAMATLVSGIGPMPVVAAGYVGFITPSLIVGRMAAERRREAENAISSLVEWTYAMVASGRPVESALVALARRGTGVPLVDDVLVRLDRDYTLGAPLHVSLAREARTASLPTLARLAERLERARELGRGSIVVLQDFRDELRAAMRERALESASKIEGKLTLILTLCYLPALALLVVIPLFLTLLAGLFG